jgi:MiaB-like tRNA modifying enzyme
VKYKVYFKTFGCRTNIYDTQIMQQNLKSYVLTQSEDEADIVVVNSCTVTNQADGSVRGYINRLNKKGKKVVLAGCGAFSKGEELFEKGSVAGVFGHSEKSNIDALLQLDTPFFRLGDLESLDDSIVEDFSSKTKAFIKIQEGCNFECSYCIIPSVRGNARSQDEQKILDQITKLSQNGFGEFVLTGTNIGSYGRDTGSSLAKLLKRISLINGVKRVRLGSIEPVQIDDEFIELLDESWLEKHLHIALQHTNEQMLRLMRRRNSLKKDLELFLKISQKGFALGTDFIVGHPGESEEVWLNALENFKRFPLTHIHAFRFSPRAGTHSTTLKNVVAGDIAKKRLGILQDIVVGNSLKFRESQKNSLLVLVEDKKDSFQVGYDQYYNKILIQSSKDIQKEWIFIEDYEVKADANYAKIV